MSFSEQQERQPQVGRVISTELNRRLLFRKHLRLATGADYPNALIFGHGYWRLVGLYQELKCMLEQTVCNLKQCQDNHCQMQAQADAVVNASHGYFSSVLALFKTSEATDLVVYEAPADYLNVNQDSKGAHYCLHADELAPLVAILNEVIVEVLTDEYADFPDQGEDADVLPAIYHTLRRYGYDSLSHLPIDHFSAHHKRADYWADVYRFDVPEWRMQHLHSYSNEVSLSYRRSDLKWYCGQCLRYRFEQYCKASQPKKRRFENNVLQGLSSST